MLFCSEFKQYKGEIIVNAKKELVGNLEGNASIKCAVIFQDFGYSDVDDYKRYILKINYSEQEYNDFLSSLDFEYDNGYGGQEIYGVVWLNDGTWLSRGEYDGSEWWKHNVLPDIPEECL